MKKLYEVIKGQAEGKKFLADVRTQVLSHLLARGYIKELKDEIETKELKHEPKTKHRVSRKRKN